MAGSGLDQLVQAWRELFERTRRTQKPTSQRSVSILRVLKDPIEIRESIELDDTQPPAIPKWAIPPTWSASTNAKWSGGGKWQ